MQTHVRIEIDLVRTHAIKPSELSILSCEKGPRPKADAFFTAENEELRGF